MKLKLFTTWALLCLALTTFVSCSFKSNEKLNPQVITGINELKIDPNGDSDGDGVKDGEEVALGRNPFVAELPDLKVRFLQNYNIEVFYHQKNTDPIKDQKSFVIDTVVKDTNPDFKFRVGNVFARNHALKTAASFGRFSSHTQGVFEEHDLSWVSYPEIDPKFFHVEAIKYRDIFNDQNVIDDIKITLSNQAKLNESAFFKEIKNLKLNFYFLNHETENHEVLASTNIDRHFQSGVYESFDVVIDHAPVGLLKESFFKRGEFIISEVEDFEIPSMTTNYKTLLASIKAKSVPVLYETPLEEKIYYVATNRNVSFQNILKAVFDKNYQVKEDALLKIGQFENNLTSFTHLKEVKDKDKLGKWFVMTNEFKENFLDHGYTPSDRIILSYITGSDLSEQTQESIYSYVPKIDGNKSESILPLGNITPNSKVEFTLHPINRFGRTVTKQQEVFNRPGGSCGKNCIQLAMNCTWDVNVFKDYNEGFLFSPDLLGEGEKLDLIINGETYRLVDLLKEKKILLSKTDVGVHVTINNISAIKEINDVDENTLSLKVRSFAGSNFFGVKLVDVGGIWQGFGGCPFNTPAVAEKYQTQLSNETRNLDEILGWINQAHQRGWPYPITNVASGSYYQEISIGLSSSIENYYN
ncbi:MAG: thrombospondin type 3 repeat-containing protein [Bacteriovorax sp.]|nr:thrombospondin type 3 repeat-containing protein [Bacteriovorax sp.]